jgi:hypothetical protein
MKWFFNWLYKGLKNVESDEEERRADRDSPLIPRVRAARSPGLKINMAVGTSTPEGHVHLNQQPLHFKIYPATGGHIVEYTFYNEKRDNNDQALHLIPSELDLGTELAKIMTLEALKR